MNGAAVYKELRALILRCELMPGQLIFEQQLARRFGVSKSPIRDALVRLQEQDLVEVKSRSGYRVASLTATDAENLYEMRRLYERACVKGAILRATDRDFDEVAQCITIDPRMTASDWIVLNRGFHAKIAEISGNTVLARATMRLTDLFERFTYLKVGRLPQPVDFTHFNNEHVALLATLRIRNEAAALALIDGHIEGSRQRTLEVVEALRD